MAITSLSQSIVIALVLLSVATIHGHAHYKRKTPNFKQTIDPTKYVPAKNNIPLRKEITEILPLAFDPLPLGSIKAHGWLRSQLLVQANGLSGNLDHIWADIARSQWIGGTAEGWERGPYWLDGMTALAYSLDEQWLKDKVEFWMNAIITSQQPDGMLGPVYPNGNLGQGSDPSNDTWPSSLVLKAMTQYYEATSDPRVIPTMTRFLKFVDVLTETTPLFSWGAYRWQDLELSVFWLYEQTGDSFLLPLAVKIYNQGFNWTNYYQTFPCRIKYDESICGDGMENHGVNIGQALKAPSVTYRITGSPVDSSGTSEFLSKLDEYHGCASGIFAADELLAGLMPSQGSETCQVVEDMFSLEMSFAILGNLSFIDRLELITFNAMPGSNTPDMWGHQYVQQANQVISMYSEDRVYVNDGPESNMFGIAPNYGCCTANFNQGWPKYVEYMFMTTASNQLVAVSLGPAKVKTTINGVEVDVKADTDYPFDDTITYSISVNKKASFPFCIRIPSWSSNATVTIGSEVNKAAAGSLYCTSNVWSTGVTQVIVKVPMQIGITFRYNNTVSINYGPLVLSLQIGTAWYGVDEEKLLWEIENTTAWNYALQIDFSNPSNSIQVQKNTLNYDCPFCPETPAISATVQGRKLPSWDIELNAAAPPPKSPVTSDEPLETLTLVPYGSAPLRLTEFPWLE